ncbi:hypothetical protein CMV_025075 [Castanea mollissima]|uniref:Uncharacterized protein n=1 Tax=Castanea mollissima TaxID=60419 RepID=A0A8J4QE48_9ROSI|nr:hypothetical protein CMV_025075 [Castanea mollissima]
MIELFYLVNIYNAQRPNPCQTLQYNLIEEGSNYQVLTSSDSATKLIDIAALLGKSMGLALVDCSASSETIGVMKQVVDLGCCIAMANKKPLTSTMEDYDKLVSHPPL